MKNKEYEELCSQKNKEQVNKKANKTARGKLSLSERSLRIKLDTVQLQKICFTVLRRKDKLLWKMSSVLSLIY